MTEGIGAVVLVQIEDMVPIDVLEVIVPAPAGHWGSLNLKEMDDRNLHGA